MHLTQLSPVLEATLQKAGFEAAELNHEAREPGHLLIGIMTMPQNPARTVLEDFGIDIRKLRSVIAKKYPQVGDNMGYIDASSTATYDVFDRADELAQKDRDHVALQRLDHLLRALVVVDPVVVVVLVDFGIGSRGILGRLDIEVANSSN